MRELIRKLLGGRPASHERRNGQESPRREDKTAARAPESPDEEFKWFFPPSTVTDPAAWDRYWAEQINHRTAGWVHLFCRDGELVDAMRANGLKTVLCVGNGISLEPRALAWAGFDVTALDLSPVAATLAVQAEPSEELLASLVDGRSGGLNGKFEFVTGDLFDASCCPGPYDVIIERKTLQLFPEESRSQAIQAVANRLASPGIFFSQCHDAAWDGSRPQRHATKVWFEAEGWPRWKAGSRLESRVAWLLFTSG